jgi:hypothetical protein
MQDRDSELLSEAYRKVYNETNLPSTEGGSPEQEHSINLLTSHGYKFDNWISGAIEGTQAALLSKKPNRYATHYAEVEADGSINGMKPEMFMQGQVPAGENSEDELDVDSGYDADSPNYRP